MRSVSGFRPAAILARCICAPGLSVFAKSRLFCYGFIGIFPNISNNYLAILPILFVTPVLWNSFRTAGSYVTSPIFSTNNLRVATVSTFTGIIDKDKDMKKKAKFYWLTLASYHIGVVLACVPSVFIGVNSIWFGFVSIALSTASYMWLCGVFDREESFAASEGLAAQSEII